MDKLLELVKLLDMHKLKSIEIIDNKTNSSSKLMKFYKGLKNGRITNDKDAINLLYPDTENPNAYYKLKHTLRDRLFNTIFFIDVKSNKYSDIHKAKLNTQKYKNLVGILTTKGLSLNAIYISKKYLKIASFYEFTEEQIVFARTLRSFVATKTGNQKLFIYYDKIVSESIDLFKSEMKIEGYFLKIMSIYVNDKSTKPHVYSEIINILNDLKNYQPLKPSANWIYHYAMLETFKYMCINDYQKALDVSENALLKIAALPFKHTKSIVNISSQSIACCIQLKKYKKGEKFINLGLQIIEEGIFNWFKYKELHLNLCLHTNKYAKAWDIFNETASNKNFKKLNHNIKEIWKIYEAWLHFFIASKIIKIQDLNYKSFKIARYANEVPLFSKDKRGMNVPILISQIVLLLHQKKYDIVIDRMEAISKYKDRYIDKEYNLRSHIFIKMLLKIPLLDFNQKSVIKETKEDLDLLKKITLDIANQSENIEIIPYEDVWEIVLKQLNT